MSDLITDLKDLVAKHERSKAEAGPVIRWIPICDEYRTSSRCMVFTEKGGSAIAAGKNGDVRRVLVWCQVLIQENADDVTLLNVVKP